MDTKKHLGRDYQPRLIDAQIQQALNISGAVVIEGVRACGKTMTGLHHSNSSIFLDSAEAQALLAIDPAFALDGQAPHLIDEWQLHPEIWNQVRREVDFRGGFGEFILTGSAVPKDDETRHTGAGRFMRVRQRTLTWSERETPENPISLAELFNGTRLSPNTKREEIGTIISRLMQSGFPAQQGLAPAQSQILAQAYLEEITRTDLHRLENIRQSPAVLQNLLRALARCVAQEVNISTIRKDLLQVTPSISTDTVSHYITLLERVFAIETVSAWAPKLRSRARLRTNKKIHFADPSLAVAALNAGEKTLREDPETLGFVFESAAVHDLAVMAEALGGKIYHYRDSNGYEIDAVIELPDGRWGAFEIKLGVGHVEKGIESLQKAVAQIDASTPPAVMAVISGTGMTYTEPKSGVHTFPLSSLTI
ncbi:ATP-binding protein [Rothia aerolata]|uniref:ATPase n=1 Tax=Rothia aerolata TaxID=1812262 RepID=A0A917MSZ2_9MICC|nr:DUF4143 domain-containing protein [Rothia aerolata]GGH62470.1 ATPase [Rothia aerolata]